MDLFGSRLVPRLDARVILAVGMVVFGVGEGALGAAPSVGLLGPGRIMQGLGSGLVLGASLQGALRVNPDRVRALGSLNGAYLLGLAIGAPLGGFTAALLPGLAGYRLGFFACFAVAVLVTFALIALLPSLPAAEHAGRPRVSFPRLVGAPGIGPAMVLGTLGEFLRGAVVYTTIPLLGLARHYSPATIGVAVGLLVASEIVTMRALTRVIGRLGLTNSLMATLAIGVLAAGSFTILHGQAAYLLGATVFGVALAGATLAPALLIVSLNDDDPATGLASYRMACGTGLLVGAVGAGTMVVAMGPSGVFSAVAALLAGSVVLTRRLRRRLDEGGGSGRD